MNRPFFSRLAANDLDDILDYISRDKPIAAASFVEMLREKCFFLAAHPEIGERRPEIGCEIRSFSVGSYVIFFRPVQGGIQVARVIHGSRDYPSRS